MPIYEARAPAPPPDTAGSSPHELDYTPVPQASGAALGRAPGRAAGGADSTPTTTQNIPVSSIEQLSNMSAPPIDYSSSMRTQKARGGTALTPQRPVPAKIGLVTEAPRRPLSAKLGLVTEEIPLPCAPCAELVSAIKDGKRLCPDLYNTHHASILRTRFIPGFEYVQEHGAPNAALPYSTSRHGQGLRLPGVPQEGAPSAKYAAPNQKVVSGRPNEAAARGTRKPTTMPVSSRVSSPSPSPSSPSQINWKDEYERERSIRVEEQSALAEYLQRVHEELRHAKELLCAKNVREAERAAKRAAQHSGSSSRISPQRSSIPAAFCSRSNSSTGMHSPSKFPGDSHRGQRSLEILSPPEIRRSPRASQLTASPMHYPAQHVEVHEQQPHDLGQEHHHHQHHRHHHHHHHHHHQQHDQHGPPKQRYDSESYRTPTKDISEMRYVDFSGSSRDEYEYDRGRAPMPRISRRGRKRRLSSRRSADVEDCYNKRRKKLNFGTSSPVSRPFGSIFVRVLSEDRYDCEPHRFDQSYDTYVRGHRYD